MSAEQLGPVLLLGGGLAVVGYVLHKVGQWLIKLLEALAAIAVVFLTAWVAIKSVWLAGRWIVRHWRTTVATAVVATWCYLWGWPSLAITVAAVVATLALGRLATVAAFDVRVGRHLRAWWLRWWYYALKLPGWFRSCRLSVPDSDRSIQVSLQVLRRTTMAPRQKPRPDQLPRILGVRSGPSWDEVRVRLVPGQTPEDFDAAARPLAVARGVARCQVRELAPNMVSIDFQRRDLLAQVVTARQLAATDEGSAVDLRRVWSGRTEYGQDWFQPLIGGHTLYVGSTGAGKNSFTWCPLCSIAPAIRDGLVRVSGIDPKGMELAYGRGIFSRYAVTAREALGGRCRTAGSGLRSAR